MFDADRVAIRRLLPPQDGVQTVAPQVGSG